MGKKIITQVCEETEIDCNMVISEMVRRGLTIDTEQKMKDIAAANGLEPMQLYEAMVEIVSDSETK